MKRSLTISLAQQRAKGVSALLFVQVAARIPKPQLLYGQILLLRDVATVDLKLCRKRDASVTQKKI